MIGVSMERTGGDIILSFALNGSWEAPFGQAFRFPVKRRQQGTGGAGTGGVSSLSSLKLTPAVSFESSFQFRMNTGEAPFAQVCPSGFRSVRHWVRQRLEKATARLASRVEYGKLKPTTGGAQMDITDGTGKNKNTTTLKVTAGFPTATLTGCLITTGKWYYEVTIQVRVCVCEACVCETCVCEKHVCVTCVCDV